MPGQSALLEAASAAPVRVARVAVDVALAHLDRLFDYEIPLTLADQVVPGCRVKVRFAGVLRDGYVIEVAEGTEVAGPLSKLAKVISPEPVVSRASYELIRLVADHYAGVWSDVARSAIPPRHAATEKAPQREWPAPTRLDSPARVLPGYPDGAGFLAALADGRAPRALWQAAAVDAAPGDLIGGVIEAADACLASGRGVVVVVPTLRELSPAAERLAVAFGTGAVAVLSAEQGRSARYRNFLAVSRGQARIVVGTRGAVFSPLADLGLVVVIDDGNDVHVEPRAPRFHARAVGVLRAGHEAAGMLIAGYSRSTDAQWLVERGWLREIGLDPAATRRVMPPVRAVGDDERDRVREPTAVKLRIPSAAFRFLRDRLTQGPVLVQVPRAGHSAALACARCHSRATCPRCDAPMRAIRRDEPQCSLCGHVPTRWSCAICHSTQLRTPLPGATRTAEELARAFPGVLAVNSSAERIRDAVDATPAIVVATPGAEPPAEGGYAGVLILDAEVSLGRLDVRSGEEAVRRWSNAIALVRPPEEGGSALIVGASGHAAVQALLRADVKGFVLRELTERAEAGLTPAAKLVRVSGDADAVRAFLGNEDWAGAEVLGPTEVAAHPEPRWAALLRAPLAEGKALVTRVKHAAAIRSARKQGGLVIVEVDPETMG
ncbi:MAG TPA: primosomal protein N' [Arachnia sp.]|nr:primosomal protein N' [Arachnia sp.]HMT87308.1 primosomal protein N' [Arachnia sp.]